MASLVFSPFVVMQPVGMSQWNRTTTGKQTLGFWPTQSLNAQQAECRPDPETNLEQQVFSAVESLYKDALKPCSRILRKRLSEPEFGLNVTMQEIQEVCERSPLISVEPAEGNEFAALLVGRDHEFVDVHSPEDVYPASLWTAAATHFSTTPLCISGGRYSCGLELKNRQLPFLSGLSLGQICHVVQLAISQKKLLGFKGSAIVPYNHSQSMVKDRCAEHSRPAHTAGGSIALSWELVRACLLDVLQSSQNSIPLSNIKRTFRARFQLELSETALGHSKLSELLQDERLSSFCEVRLDRSGYVVALKTAFQASPSVLPEVNAVQESPSKPPGTNASQARPGMPPGVWASANFPQPGQSTPGSDTTCKSPPAVCEALRQTSSSETETLDEASESDEDYDAACELYHNPTELHESIHSVQCPWGPTPDGSFINLEDRQYEGLPEQWPQLLNRMAEIAEELPDLTATASKQPQRPTLAVLERSGTRPLRKSSSCGSLRLSGGL